MIPTKTAALFDGWNETMIFSCLSGTMGKVYSVGDKSAAAVIADFAFFAGEANEELLEYSPAAREGDFAILVPGNCGWERLIEEKLSGKVRRVTRYATTDSPDFDRNKLSALAAPPEDYKICPVDRGIFDLLGNSEWSKDLTAQFVSFEEYEAHGCGCVALDSTGRPVSGASSYTWYPDGIEVEIDTMQKARGKGLATCCGAALVLSCLDRGLYPGWDAHNTASLKIAQRLGYKLSHEYTAYEYVK